MIEKERRQCSLNEPCKIIEPTFYFQIEESFDVIQSAKDSGPVDFTFDKEVILLSSYKIILNY